MNAKARIAQIEAVLEKHRVPARRGLPATVLLSHEDADWLVKTLKQYIWERERAR